MHVVSITSGIDANTAFRTTLSSVCSTAGVTYRVAAGSSYSYDRWIQDSSEPGIEYLPSTTGRRRIDNVLQCARNRPVDAWCISNLFDPDFDLIREFAASSTSMNYGGNLEIIPPHTVGATLRPWGRILVGGGTGTLIGGGSVTRQFAIEYRQFFNALAYQGTSTLEIHTEWLAVGHVDEVVQVVPAPATARGWKIALSSTTLAKSLITGLPSGTPVFEGRTTYGWETTVGAILGDTALMTYNDGAQVKLDAIKTYLKTNCGLTDADFVELPVLYEDVGSLYAAAYNPGVVNFIVIPSTTGTIHIIVPDPEGPDAPTDVWADDVKTKLEALGTVANPIVVTFADVFYSYHDLLGEAHCGTNTVRTPPADDWWNK
jgi:protein-arginine deiminase